MSHYTAEVVYAEGYIPLCVAVYDGRETRPVHAHVTGYAAHLCIRDQRVRHGVATYDRTPVYLADESAHILYVLLAAGTNDGYPRRAVYYAVIRMYQSNKAAHGRFVCRIGSHYAPPHLRVAYAPYAVSDYVAADYAVIIILTHSCYQPRRTAGHIYLSLHRASVHRSTVEAHEQADSPIA